MALHASPSRLLLDTVHKTHGVCLDAIARYCRVANYLAAAQLYLKENILLEGPLQPEYLKKLQSARWDICPGVNLIYAHLNHLIVRYDANMFLVSEARASIAAGLANLYLEGSLQHYYPEMTLDRVGLERFVKSFSWLGDSPNYLFPGFPGIVSTDSEEGHALSTAFGAVVDHPHLIVACIVGDGDDGEVEEAWRSHMFLDPVEAGAVLPFLYLSSTNSARPIGYAAMSNEELESLFRGYGYHPIIIGGNDLNAGLYVELDQAYRKIRAIQRLARSGHPVLQPRWPMIILRPPRDWTDGKTLDGMRSAERAFHWQPVQELDLKSGPELPALIEQWLRSYHIEEMFTKHGQLLPEIIKQCPRGRRRMGTNARAFFIPGKEFFYVAAYSCSPRWHARGRTGTSTGSADSQGVRRDADAGKLPAPTARIRLCARRGASAGKDQRG